MPTTRVLDPDRGEDRVLQPVPGAGIRRYPALRQQLAAAEDLRASRFHGLAGQPQGRFRRLAGPVPAQHIVRAGQYQDVAIPATPRRCLLALAAPAGVQPGAQVLSGESGGVERGVGGAIGVGTQVPVGTGQLEPHQRDHATATAAMAAMIAMSTAGLSMLTSLAAGPFGGVQLGADERHSPQPVNR